MREPSLAREGGQRASGIIDTLSAGYGVVNHRIWIVLIPVLLDLFLWLGPQVSIAPVVGQALTFWQAPTELTADQVQSFEEWRRGAMSVADELNALSLLSPAPVGVPSVMVLLRGRGPLYLVDNWGAALGMMLGAALVGLMLGSVLYALLAQQVRSGGVSVPSVFWQAFVGWRRVVGLLLVLAGIALLLGLPVVFVLASALLVSPGLGSFGFMFVGVALVWLQLYLYFAPHAIFVSRDGPLQAIRRSVMLVRKHVWPTVLLVGLTWLILLGMGQVWQYLAEAAGPGGALLGIIGNAYVASGLVAASMVFYWERTEQTDGRSLRGKVFSA